MSTAHSRRGLATGLVLVAIAACGGSVSTIDPASSSSGSTGSIPNGPSGTSSSSSGGDEDRDPKDGGRTKDAAKDAAGPNDKRCPSSFKAPKGNCDVGVTCGYAEGSCACLGYCGGPPPPPDVDQSHWTCTPKRTDGCPELAPENGDGCNGPKSCTYGDCCVQTFVCSAGGKWLGGVLQCPP
jgi:hypothetical protein